MRRLPWLSSLFAALFTCAAVGSATGQDPASQLQLQLRPLRDSLALTDSLIVEIAVVNKGPKAVHAVVPMKWPNAQLSIYVSRSDGLSLAGRNFVFPDTYPGSYADDWGTRIPPEGFVGRLITLAGSHDTTAAGYILPSEGDYRIWGSLQATLPDVDRIVRLVSDTVSVTVRR